MTLIGEAAGDTEVKHARPFMGAAGLRLEKMIQRAGYQRGDFQLLSTVSCAPPLGRFSGDDPYYGTAIDHCRQYWEPRVDASTKVIMPLGNMALEAVTGHSGILSKRGYVEWSDTYGAFVLPTVHPFYIMRGNGNWESAFIYDLRHAVEVAAEGWSPVERAYLLDPNPLEALAWLNSYAAELARNPNCDITADIETPDKSASEDETDINLGYQAGPIYRIGFAYQPQIGLTRCISVPWTISYLPFIRAVLQTAKVVVFCPGVNERILTADLRWVRAGDVTVGDTLASFDEYPREGRKTRYFKTGTVTAAVETSTLLCRVTFEDGTSVDVTPHHQWLAKRKGKNGDTWVATSELLGCRVTRYAAPWEADHSRDAGYLAGFYDGEGSVSKQKRGSLSVNASQNQGPLRDAVIDLVRAKGFSVSSYETGDRSAKSFGIRGPLGSKLRFLGQIRPARLLAKAQPAMWGSTQVHAPRLLVVAVEPLGPRATMQISVDARTYILEGFPSHNCYRHFDVPRITAHGIHIKGEITDLQEAWHCLHSDLPKKLEHMAPYLVPRQFAWKHLSGSQPAYYNALDVGVQIDAWWRVLELLKAAGMLELYERDIRGLNPILIHMNTVGMPINATKRIAASEKLLKLKEENRQKLNDAASLARPTKIYNKFREGLVEVPRNAVEKYCSLCKKVRVNKKHPCLTKKSAEIRERVIVVAGYALPLDFKPSQKGMLRYVQFKNYRVITRMDRSVRPARKTTPMDENAIRRYALTHPTDPLFPLVLEERELNKLLGTYIGRVTESEAKELTPEQQWEAAFRAAQYQKDDEGHVRKLKTVDLGPGGEGWTQQNSITDEDIPF